MSGSPTLNLSKLTDFDWDSLLILPPYTSEERIEHKLNVNLSSVKNVGISSRDDIDLLVFFKEKRAIRMVEYLRYPGDFKQKEVKFISKKDAIFNVEVTGMTTAEGNKWIELTQIKK